MAAGIAANDCTAQDDLMALLEEEAEPVSEPVTATFKAIRIINAQSVETVKAKTLLFNVAHRFGNTSSGAHALYGLDNASNIRIAFDYGVTDRLLIGIGRSKVKEHIDGSIKYKILAQHPDKMPVTMTWFSNLALTPMKSPTNADGSDKWTKTAHRFSYTHQLIVGRKFSPAFSLELLPTMIHRNYINKLVNTANGGVETNDLFVVGVAGRIKISQRFSLVGDFFYVFSKFRENNVDKPYFPPLGLGIEIETGGHVFHINFTNSAGLIENDYIPNTSDSWEDGDIKLGFNIGRVFYL